MEPTKSLFLLRSSLVGLALTLGGCPVYLEEYSDEYDEWWEDCPDDDEWDACLHGGDCPDAGPALDAAPPPDGGRTPECQRNADCDEGASCQAGVCIDIPPTACVYHADCPVGFACESNLCEPSTICEGDGDCGNGQACDERHTCVGGEPVACVRDQDCGEQARCIFGACQSADEDICQFNHDCGPGRACLDGACTPRCSETAECPSGTLCDSGLCVPGSGSECVLSSQCDGGHCVEGHCLTDCQADGDCAAGLEVCAEDGLCRPDTAPRPFCVGDGECAVGHVCVDGVCRSPCPNGTHEECQRFDSQLPICADNGLCYSVAETDPECARTSECPDAQQCIDGMCRN